MYYILYTNSDLDRKSQESMLYVVVVVVVRVAGQSRVPHPHHNMISRVWAEILNCRVSEIDLTCMGEVQVTGV